MFDAQDHLTTLSSRAPAIARMLSPLGREIAFPKGIPFQASQAAKTRLKATVGQVTDGAGQPLPLPSMAADLGVLDLRSSLLYAPQPGFPALRTAWLARQRDLAGDADTIASLPFATHGLTHGLGLLADLFADPDTTVIIPTPYWENYGLLFRMRAKATLRTFPFFDADDGFNLAGLSDALEQTTGKAILLLNLPSNPTGWSPTPEVADAIADRIAAHPGPLVAVVDDAYQGVVHEPGLVDHSMYWRLAQRADLDRTLVVKVDGATKEMLFFAGRVGFLTFNTPDPVSDVLHNKLNAVIRGSVGGPPGPSLTLLQRAVQRPGIRDEFAQILSVITARYHVLREALADAGEVLRPLPFNSAYFALLRLPEHKRADDVRLELIRDKSVGTIAVPELNALRLAYCSTTEDDLRAVVAAVAEVAGR